MDKKEIAIGLLRAKYEELQGERYPKRSDFSEEEVVMIKAHLGPWPGAFGAAKIKPIKTI